MALDQADLCRLKECCAPDCTVTPAYIVTKSSRVAGDSGRRSLVVTVSDPAGAATVRHGTATQAEPLSLSLGPGQAGQGSA